MTYSIRFGVGLPYFSNESFAPIAEAAILAEKLGFDSLWMPDHGYLPWEALATLSAIAAKTKDIKLGTCVLDVNRRNPATLAQMTSTLDVISGGRLILGIGSGNPGVNPYGFPLDKPVTRMRESIEIMERLWTESSVDFTGKFYRFEKASIGAKPVQRPHPPIWIAAFGPVMRKIAGEIGDGFITQNIPPTIFEEELSSVRNCAMTASRDPSQIQPVLASLPVSVSRDYATARRNIEPIARSWLTRTTVSRFAQRLGFAAPWTRPDDVPAEAIERCFIFGTPRECVAKIEEYVEAGVRYFIALRILPPGADSLELFSNEVVSHFK